MKHIPTSLERIHKPQRRSHCPIHFAMELFGDRWSFLLVRDIVLFDKHTYGEFLRSEEQIATNVLAARLALLECEGILCKTSYPTDKRKDVYALTEKGLDLIPLLLDLVVWSAAYDPETDAPRAFVERIRTDREHLIEEITETVRQGGCVFSHPMRLPLR
jgi:DNA-binding HxlR family transcriptional regulator